MQDEPAVKSRAVWLYFGFVTFSILGSLFSRLTSLDPGPIARPAAAFTLLAGCYAAFEPIVRAEGSRALCALAAVWTIGAFAEIVGIYSGIPFGEYHYTDRWWPIMHLAGIGNFPLLLPFAWALVVGAAYVAAAARLPVGAAAAAAVISMLVDQVMEPVMTHSLHYWQWSQTGPLMGGTPVINAIGWLGVSFLAATAMRLILRRRPPPSSSPTLVLIAYVVMVLCIGAVRTI